MRSTTDLHLNNTRIENYIQHDVQEVKTYKSINYKFVFFVPD